MLVVAHLRAVTAALVNAAEGPRRVPGSEGVVRRASPNRFHFMRTEDSSIWQPAPDVNYAKTSSNNNLTFIRNLRQSN